VRILVTNDDGVRAPGIAALALVAASTGHDVVVVAPLIDYSGAGAAVGPVHSRAGVDYEAHAIEGLGDMPTYGIDGPPALAVILACVGGFGPRPDIVLSGINHGVNVGRSAMHSGTVGAALTGAHFGLRCLAVSIRWGDDPVPWETPATMAAALVPVLEQAPAGTTLNLNVPNVALGALRGLRHGRLGRVGTIRSAVHVTGDDNTPLPHVALPPGQTGTLRLDLAAPGTSTRVHPDTDAGLLARDYASLTALVGVREAGAETDDVIDDALEALYAVSGVAPGQDPDEEGFTSGSDPETATA
jgi:5'-nucleotidase